MTALRYSLDTNIGSAAIRQPGPPLAMPEYLHAEKLFLGQLAALGWTVIDQG